MSKIIQILLIVFFAGALIFTGCKKNNDNSNPNSGIPLGGPTVVLSPAADSGLAGDLIKIGYSVAAPNGVANFHFEENYDVNPVRVLKDSNPASHPLVDDEVLNYRIPDSATSGQKINITFKVTDTKGKTVTKTATITVLASRPRISVTQNKTTASKGDSVLFTITMKSTEKNIGTLTVGQSINGGSYGEIATFKYSFQSQVVLSWYYKVPFTVSPSDHISLLFTVSNSAGVTNFLSKSIDVL
jgi:hypothetical protein